MPQHIGIVACSSEGAALCYRTICHEGEKRLGKYAHPEVSMHTFPLSEYMSFIRVGDWDGVAQLMLRSAQKVAKCGADFIICPDNTIHEAYDLVAPKSDLPWLHIAAAVGEEAQRQGFRRLGILGTRYLMEGPVYPAMLDRLGIAYLFPDPEEREQISDIIFEELVEGLFTVTARDYISRVINKLEKRDCDAVVLGCTEIPLIIQEEDSLLPILDSTRILALVALQRAVESEPEK
ncbi:MAG: amino acid racemase [bacterium]